MSINRRSFITSSVAGAAGLSLANPSVSSLCAAAQKNAAWTNKMAINPDISNMRVVCFHDEKMCTTPTSSVFTVVNAAVDSDRVGANMDEMAKQLAQKPTADEAWKTIFRSSKPWDQTKAAIKVNAVMPNLPRAAIVKKITDVLFGFGVQPANIVVYDGHSNAAKDDSKDKYLSCASLTDSSKIRAVISDHYKDMGGVQSVTIPGVATAVGPKNLIAGVTDILVNIAVNKGHSEFAGTTTLCLKNHFGTIIEKEGGDAFNLHSTDALININKVDAIVGGTPVRQQLCIIDSLLASKQGPAVSFDSKLDRIIMGTFAGAVDYCCVKKVREEVKNWKHNATAVKRFLSDFGYAETDPEWVEITPTGITTEKVNPVSPAAAVSFTILHPSLRRSTIRFFIPSGNRDRLRTRIFDMRGSLVRELNSPAGSSTILWDGTATGGRSIGTGNYVVAISAGAFRAAEKMTMVQ